jgi:hypothetical protein
LLGVPRLGESTTEDTEDTEECFLGDGVRGGASAMKRPRYGVPDTASAVRRFSFNERRDDSRGTDGAGLNPRD